MMSIKTVGGHKSILTFNEKVWLGILVVCSLFWVMLAAAGVYAVIA